MKYSYPALALFIIAGLAACPAVSNASYLEISLDGKPVLTEHDVEKAEATEDEVSHRYQLTLKLDKTAAAMFKKLTASNLGKKFDIRLNGTKISSPLINSEIGSGRMSLAVNYGKKKAQEIAEGLNFIGREGGMLSADDQLAYQYFGGPLGHTLRLIKLATKEFSEPAEILDTMNLKIQKDQVFHYNSEVYCTLQDTPAFVIISRSELEKKSFRPLQAWTIDMDKKKFIPAPVAKVDCKRN